MLEYQGYTGKVVQAQLEGKSLNQWIAEKLAQST